MQASCGPASAAPANGPFSPQERAMQEELHQLRAAKAHLEQLLRVKRAFQQAEFAKHDAEVAEMEMQMHVARASAQLAQQQHAQALEQQRQELAAAQQRREDALRSLQDMAGLLSAATRQEEAARAQAAAAGAMAANARAQRDMLAARLAEAERQLASVAAAAGDAQPSVDTPVSNTPRQAQSTPPLQQQPVEEDVHAHALDARPTQQQQAAWPGVRPHRSTDEEPTVTVAAPTAPHVVPPVQPSSTGAAAAARHDTTTPSHPPSLRPSLGQPTRPQPRARSDLPPPPPLGKLPFPLPRARLNETSYGRCCECNKMHPGTPCGLTHPWTACAADLDKMWRVYRELCPTTPAARFGEDFARVPYTQRVELLGARWGQLLAFEWDDDDDDSGGGGNGEPPKKHAQGRSASCASRRREEDEEERRGRGVEGRQQSLRPRSPSPSARPGRGGWDTAAPSGELPFPLPPLTVSEDAHGACTFCKRSIHLGKPCLARFPWWAGNSGLSAQMWVLHRRLFPHEPTAEHEAFRVVAGFGVDVTRVVLGCGPGGSTVLMVPRAGGCEPLPSAESGGGGGGAREGTAAALGGRMRGRSRSRERAVKEERGRRGERRSRSRSREGKEERGRRGERRSRSRSREGKEERGRRRERRSRSRSRSTPTRSRSSGEGRRGRAEG